MGETYRAVLRGDRVEWIGPAPSLEGDTEVVITFLEVEPEEVLRARGRSAVAALEEMAKERAIAQTGDASAGEREIRPDGTLPREE